MIQLIDLWTKKTKSCLILNILIMMPTNNHYITQGCTDSHLPDLLPCQQEVWVILCLCLERWELAVTCGASIQLCILLLSSSFSLPFVGAMARGQLTSHSATSCLRGLLIFLSVSQSVKALAKFHTRRLWITPTLPAELADGGEGTEALNSLSSLQSSIADLTSLVFVVLQALHLGCLPVCLSVKTAYCVWYTCVQHVTKLAVC